MTATTIFRIKEGLRVVQAEDRLPDAVGDGCRVDFGEGRRGDVQGDFSLKFGGVRARA